MTNKEARKVLQEVWRNERTDYESVEVKEAIDRAIKALQERPEGEWLFTEVQPDYTVKGQCSICKERTRIGNYCRICGAEMGVKKNGQI